MLPIGISPHYFRKARFDLFTYDGRWLGDTFASNAHDAAANSLGAYYAKER